MTYQAALMQLGFVKESQMVYALHTDKGRHIKVDSSCHMISFFDNIAPCELRQYRLTKSSGTVPSIIKALAKEGFSPLGRRLNRLMKGGVIL